MCTHVATGGFVRNSCPNIEALPSVYFMIRLAQVLGTPICVGGHILASLV